MKVADVMNKQVDYVGIDTSVAEVCRYIFGRGINGVPVCKGEKVVGFITERDILAKFYPNIKEYVDDPFHAGNFEEMEKKVSEVLSLKAKDIMSKNPTVITADTPLLRAQSTMFVHKIGRLPVVDKKGNLIGIISKGDIFRAIVSGQLPFDEEKDFYDWMAKNYDYVVDWKRRLAVEIPDLMSVFKKEKVRRVIDVASSTGEHVLALAKKGIDATGLESSNLMGEKADSKARKLPEQTRKRVQFITNRYNDALSKLTEKFDAAMFLGNALPHVIYTDKNILKNVVKNLRSDNPVLVFQIANFDKVFKTQTGYQDFTIYRFSQLSSKGKAFLRFYTKNNKGIVYNVAIFNYENNQWRFRGMHTTPVVYIGKKEINNILKELGFSNISFYGSSFYDKLFNEPFDPLKSDWLNVVALK